MDPSVVSFAGNGQILVGSIHILSSMRSTNAVLDLKFVAYSVKVYQVALAVGKRANRSYLATMWYSNRVHHNQMWSNIRA